MLELLLSFDHRKGMKSTARRLMATWCEEEDVSDNEDHIDETHDADHQLPTDATADGGQTTVCEDRTTNDCATCYRCVKHASTFSRGCSKQYKHTIGLECPRETFEEAISDESFYL